MHFKDVIGELQQTASHVCYNHGRLRLKFRATWSGPCNNVCSQMDLDVRSLKSQVSSLKSQLIVEVGFDINKKVIKMLTSQLIVEVETTRNVNSNINKVLCNVGIK